jgi:unsaturated chondroitin disaccharide hydrolase
MMPAAADLIRRVDQTLVQSSGRFPMLADTVTGEWAWFEDGAWFGGFWSGLLWLSAVATGEAKYARAAADAADRLASRTYAPTIMRGFLFWYSTGVGSALGYASDQRNEVAVDAVRAMSADFDAAAQLLPPGVEDAAEYGWPRPGVCVDGLPGTVPLLSFVAERTQDPTLRSMALSHARATYALCVRADGSVAQSATYDAAGKLVSQTTISGSSRHSTWSRAQAWAMLGLAQAAHLSTEFTEPATRVAEWYLGHVPEDLVCYWDFDDPAIPDAPRDTSATAIAAAALVKLAALAGDRYRQAAQNTLHALAAKHVSGNGALVDGCYGRRKGLATSNELIWGDYFMLEAILSLDGALDTTSL